MKRLFTLLTLVGFLTFSISFIAVAQDETDGTEQTDADTTAVEEAETPEPTPAAAVVDDEAADPFATATEDDRGFHQKVKEKFIEGGPEFMGIVLICLILHALVVTSFLPVAYA